MNRHVKKSVGPKWYDLGIDLLEKDDIEELNTIQSQHSTDINICCTKMFQLWLGKHPNAASWNQLINSLRYIDLGRVAGKIEQMLLQPKPAGVHVIVHTFT